MDEPPIDLSELVVWPGNELESAIAHVLDGVHALEHPTLSRTMVRQGGVALALACAAVLAAWAPTWVVGRASARERAAELVSQWAASDALPRDIDVARVVGVFDVE